MFNFKQFHINDTHCAMKVGTDGVLLGAWADGSRAATVIDAGCGSGLISLMMAQRYPRAEIVGVDIAREACEDARANVSASPWADRVKILEADFTRLEYVRGLSRPLLIISNPPFFKETLRSPEQSRALARHGEGFDVISFIRTASALLEGPDDTIAFIAPDDRSGEIFYALSMARLYARRVCRVFTREGRPASRVMMQASLRIANAAPETIAIRDADNQYTREYLRLTSPFYLDKA